MAVLRHIRVPLEDGQFNALCSFVFNLGSGALQSSTLRRKINRGDYIGAANEFPRWVYAGGRKLKGLVRRREHERLMFIG
jgi:lysozyme